MSTDCELAEAFVKESKHRVAFCRGILNHSLETILYLIRHAQSQPRASQHYSEWRLSSKGQRQSQQLTELLEPLGIEQIFSSPFVRCRETVGPFARKHRVQVVVADDLRERLVAKELRDDFHELCCRSWEDFDFALPGCETSAEAQNRFVKAVEVIADGHGQGPLALCTHGNVIGLFLNWVENRAGRKDAEQLTNPDVLRVVRRAGVFAWDRSFRLKGLELIATDQGETPGPDGRKTRQS